MILRRFKAEAVPFVKFKLSAADNKNYTAGKHISELLTLVGFILKSSASFAERHKNGLQIIFLSVRNKPADL